MATLAEVGSKLRDVYAVNIQRNATVAVRQVAVAVSEAVILATPVDTGKARSNWQVGINEDNLNVLVPYFPGRFLGLGETANASAAINAAKQTLAKTQPGDVVFVFNNTPYINILNTGYSQQAPGNYIQKAVLAGISVIKQPRIL